MKATILIVEDDEALRSTLARHLRAHGYDVIEAESAEDALAALRGGLRPGLRDPRHQPARRDGLVAAPRPGAGRGRSALRSSSRPRPPINPSRLREFDVAGYLPKPFPLETLVSTIERLLRPKEAQTRDD